MRAPFYCLPIKKSKMKSIFTLLFFCSFFFNQTVLAQGVFQETDGIVVIEIESANAYFDWVAETAISGYTGANYLHYKGPDYFNTPGNSLLTFKLNITTTGKYRFQWHSRIAQGTSNTDHNDTWLRLGDATKFYAQKGNSVLYPKGSGMTPNPNGSSSDGWFKVYQNVNNSWTWNTSTSDNDPHDIYVEFDTPGEYTLEVSARSKGHAINRMVLFHENVTASEALDLSREESANDGTSALKIIPVQKINILPNPAKDFIYLNIPEWKKQTIAYQIINLSGKIIRQERQAFEGTIDSLKISVEGLQSGLYIIQAQNEDHLFQGRFTVQ